MASTPEEPVHSIRFLLTLLQPLPSSVPLPQLGSLSDTLEDPGS